MAPLLIICLAFSISLAAPPAAGDLAHVVVELRLRGGRCVAAALSHPGVVDDQIDKPAQNGSTITKMTQAALPQPEMSWRRKGR